MCDFICLKKYLYVNDFFLFSFWCIYYNVKLVLSYMATLFSSYNLSTNLCTLLYWSTDLYNNTFPVRDIQHICGNRIAQFTAQYSAKYTTICAEVLVNGTWAYIKEDTGKNLVQLPKQPKYLNREMAWLLFQKYNLEIVV